MKKIIFLLILMLISGASVQAHETPSSTGSPELKQIKSLAGTWAGESRKPDGRTQKIKVEYKITSGGSAVVETLEPGTPHEMTSVYYDEKGKLRMTHYCMLGNRPTLELKKSGAQKFQFELIKSASINPKKDMHMHALNLSTPAADQLIQEWTCFQQGKSAGVTVFTLKKT